MRKCGALVALSRNNIAPASIRGTRPIPRAACQKRRDRATEASCDREKAMRKPDWRFRRPARARDAMPAASYRRRSRARNRSGSGMVAIMASTVASLPSVWRRAPTARVAEVDQSTVAPSSATSPASWSIGARNRRAQSRGGGDATTAECAARGASGVPSARTGGVAPPSMRANGERAMRRDNGFPRPPVHRGRCGLRSVAQAPPGFRCRMQGLRLESACSPHES